MSSLESIFSEGKTIKIGSTNILIKNISLGDLPSVIDIFNKYSELSKASKNKSTAEVLAKFIVDNFEEAKKIFLVATDLPVESIDKLNLAAATKILVEAVKENKDFLERHVRPMVESLSETFGQNKSKS